VHVEEEVFEELGSCLIFYVNTNSSSFWINIEHAFSKDLFTLCPFKFIRRTLCQDV